MTGAGRVEGTAHDERENTHKKSIRISTKTSSSCIKCRCSSRYGYGEGGGCNAWHQQNMKIITKSNIMRLATEIGFAKGFAFAAPAMYRNFSVITVCSVMSMCSACNIPQLQCRYNVSVWSAYHLLQLQCNYNVQCNVNV